MVKLGKYKIMINEPIVERELVGPGSCLDTE
jgi:hypothetical protein